MAGITEYLDACQYRKSFVEEQLALLQQDRSKHHADAERLDGVVERIRQEMVGYLLPEVQDAHLATLEKRLRYPGLMPIKKDYDGRFEAAEARRIELEAMDEIQQYDFLFDRASRDVEDVRPKYDSMKRKIGYWESSKSFKKLHERGYFDLDYKVGFFRRFFDWRDVSFLMAHLEKAADLSFDLPGKLCEHYRHLREEADAVVAAFDIRMAELKRIEGLKSEHQYILQSPERLLGELFRDLGDAIVTHLNACPEELRVEIAREDPHLNAFLRKQVGTEKQAQYLRELAVTRIDSRIQQLDQELHKINAKIHKLTMQRRRGKRKRYSRDDLARMRNVKADKWERKRAKSERMRRKIVDFDKHDRGSCASDFLWWDLMTGGAIADDIYEVREFRRQRPGWNYREYEDPASIGVETGLTGVNPYDDAAEDLASSMTAGNDDLFMDAS